ncbi:hypothetical protein BJ912DRAFT_952616 [Pholiota molesta]|nr:hypothetical protein BJ912DRAFT_952616 [Pholiota molesta]
MTFNITPTHSPLQEDHDVCVVLDDLELSGIGLFDDSTVTFNAATSTLFACDSGGGPTRIAQVNPGGCILAVCTLGDIFYVAGSFSRINGVPAANIAWSQRYPSTGDGYYTQTTTPFRAVGSGGGPNDQINALFCDAKENKVWAGGRFTSPGRGIAVFDLDTNIWSAPPCLGISGARAEVTSITTDCSHSSLSFAGSFLTVFREENAGLNGTNRPDESTSPGGHAQGFGILKWPRASTAVDASIDGTEFCGNTSLFASSTLGVQLLSALGDTIPDDSTGVNDVVHHPSGVIFVGGAFTLATGPASGSSNIIAFKDGALAALAGNGLNGEVTSLLLDGGHLYVGGAFDDTNEGTAASRLSGIAMYDVALGTWSSLGAGIDGRVR